MISIFSRVISAILALMWSAVVSAETITVNDFPFQVEQISSAGENKKISLFGETQLVESTKLEQTIVEAYLAKDNLFQLVNFNDFIPFLRSSLRDGRVDWVSMALIKALKTPTLKESDLLAVIQEISATAMGPSVFSAVFDGLGDSAEFPNVVCSMGFTGVNESSVSGHGARLLFRYQLPCLKYVSQEARKLLKSGDLAGATIILAKFGSIYGGESAEFQHEMALRAAVERIFEAVEEAQFDSIDRFLVDQNWNEEERGIFRTFLSHATPQVAREWNQTGKANDALRILTLLDSSDRDEEVMNIVTESFDSLKQSQYEVLLNTQVLTFLRWFAFRNEKFKGKYEGILEAAVREDVSTGKLKEAVALFEQLIVIRPDPSQQNDNLRMILAEAEYNTGNVEASEAILQDVRNKIPFFTRLKFLFRGAFIDSSLVFTLIASGLAIVFGIFGWSRWRNSSKPIFAGLNGASYKNGRGGDADSLNRFVKMSRSTAVSTEYHEYQRCLSAFNLTEDANVQEIKVAYRNAVKECHPDLNPNSGADEAARFIELTKTYERLLKLHDAKERNSW